MQTTFSRNGFTIRYSRLHDDWIVGKKINGKLTWMEEFTSRQDAIKWAETNNINNNN